MTKSCAFVFSKVPYGDSISQEGLDVILSFSLTVHNIGIFFVNDGVFQLIKYQNPKDIKTRNYILSFKILSLYGIKNIFLCKESLKQRGLKENSGFILKPFFLNPINLKKYINNFDYILTW